MKHSSQRIEFLLQFGNSCIRLLLSLATWLRDNAWSIGFGASLTWNIGLCRVLIAAHFQSTTSLASSWTLGVFRTMLAFGILLLRAGRLLGHRICSCIFRTCLVTLATCTRRADTVLLGRVRRGGLVVIVRLRTLLVWCVDIWLRVRKTAVLRRWFS